MSDQEAMDMQAAAEAAALAAISPTSKIQLLKVDVTACNGQPVGKYIELGATDLENIWTRTLQQRIQALDGYTSFKREGEIRIQFQLKQPMSIRDIATEQEFLHERESVLGTDIFKCKIIGLNNVRQATIGETVKATVVLPNFEILPEQIIEWLSKFGIIKEGHRYNIS